MSSKPKIRIMHILPNGSIVGYVYNDARFKDGEEIRTTPIQSFKTENTEYEVER